MRQTVMILDFGGQYKELIARRVRELGVYSEIWPCDTGIQRLRDKQPIGIIFTGGPDSVNAPGHPACDPAVFQLGVPVLGICYGMQLTAQLLGGNVERAQEREYGRITVRMKDRTSLLQDLSPSSFCWMSHTWQVSSCPPGFKMIAETDHCPMAAMADEERKIYGVQFHPEFTSRPNRPGALFVSFLEAADKYSLKK